MTHDRLHPPSSARAVLVAGQPEDGMPQRRVTVDPLRIVHLRARQEAVLHRQSTPQRLGLEHEAPARRRLGHMIGVVAPVLEVVLHLPARLLERQQRLRRLLFAPRTLAERRT